MMDTLIQADIFFFVTTVVAIVVGILVAVVLTYSALALRDLRHIAHTVRTGADLLADDIHDLRHEIKHDGVKLKSLINLTKKVYKRSKTKKK